MTDKYIEYLRAQAELRRRQLIAELNQIEEFWGFPRSVMTRDERRLEALSTTRTDDRPDTKP